MKEEVTVKTESDEWFITSLGTIKIICPFCRRYSYSWKELYLKQCPYCNAKFTVRVIAEKTIQVNK